MYDYYWSEGQYIVVNNETGEVVDYFSDLDALLEEYPDAIER